MDMAAAVLREQFGVIGYQQARELGMSYGAIRWRLRSGEWTRGLGRTYRLASSPPTWNQRALEALLASGPGSVLSHSSAAFVLGLEGFNQKPPSTLETSVQPGRRVILQGVSVHHPTDTFPWFTKRGLRVTTLARTLVDLAGVMPEERFEFTLDSAQRRYPYLAHWLEHYLGRLEPRGHAGIGMLAKLLRERTGGHTDSALEVKVWRALRRNGITNMRRQFEVKDVMRVDFAWPEHRFVLHADSTLWHLQEERLTRDALQRMRLQELGWLSLVVTNSMLKSGDAWLDSVRTQLAARAPQLQLPYGAGSMRHDPFAVPTHTSA
ncbi:MAG: DUF559 domain-containing protein [Archangium sp.]